MMSARREGGGLKSYPIVRIVCLNCGQRRRVSGLPKTFADVIYRWAKTQKGAEGKLTFYSIDAIDFVVKHHA